jgi:glycerol-3-phosphate dehydrogenase
VKITVVGAGKYGSTTVQRLAQAAAFFDEKLQVVVKVIRVGLEQIE